MKVKLPKQITVGAKKYTVVRKYTRRVPELGRINYAARLIVVATQDADGVRLSKEEQTETFWHELTHGILHDMGHPLCSSERFVGRFSRLLNRAIHSAKF